VTSLPIVESLHKAEGRRSGFGAGTESRPVDQLTFQGSEERFGDSIIAAKFDRSEAAVYRIVVYRIVVYRPVRNTGLT
jgi:hypothetical protein